MRIKTLKNSNISSYLKPNTEYEIVRIFENETFEFNMMKHGYNSNGFSRLKESAHLNGQDWIIIPEGMPNREFLADFIKLNNIKKTLVSKYLGMAENWLTTMVNEKRATRKDISDATLQDIMRKLHIDWTSQEFINVKATKSNTAYKTKPCNYSRVLDKERLQRSMWNGELCHS